jgi:very-short-patch-repair endonuclease
MTTKGVLRDRARGMRKEPSRSERALWQLLRGRQVANAKFRRQHPVLSYIADFACPEARLIVEIDGRSHDDPMQVQYDIERTKKLNEAGWRILRVRDDAVLTESHKVIEQIAKHLAP